MFNYIQRKFELEDTIIELHDRARHIKDVKIAQEIRQMADELSEKLKKEKEYGWYR